ncbi:MAG: hypothetical protein ACP5UM_14740, partial [Anaerolineae bacterium]
VTLEVAVPDDVPLERAEAILREVADANPYILGDLQAKLGAVEEALHAMPSQGPAPQETYQCLANRKTELVAFLDTHLPLTKEEKRLLER